MESGGHKPLPDLVQLSAQFSPEQQFFLCFPKQRVARGKESVSNPSPNNTRDPAKRAKFLANCGSINPPYRTVLATCGETPCWHWNRSTRSSLPRPGHRITSSIQMRDLRTLPYPSRDCQISYLNFKGFEVGI